MERISSKQEDLMSFVNGGMMKKVEMQYVFVTVMVAIQRRNWIDGSRMGTAVRLLSKKKNISKSFMIFFLFSSYNTNLHDWFQSIKP